MNRGGSSRQPLVSVLVPLYNHERFIMPCLESVLAQTYANIEIIVIDDGSRDDSFDRARRWCDEHGHRFARVLVLTQENIGVVRTLNRLIDHACGEYVALLASDDMLTPNSIEVRVRALEEHSQWLAVFGDAITVDETGRQVNASAVHDLFGGSPLALTHDRWRSADIILRWSAAGPTFMARRSAYGTSSGVGPYDESIGVEDRDFYLRLLSRGGLGFVNEIVAVYRLAQTSMSRGERTLQTRLAVAAAERKNAVAFPFPYNALLMALSASVPRHPGRVEILRAEAFRFLVRVIKLIYMLARRFRYGASMPEKR